MERPRLDSSSSARRRDSFAQRVQRQRSLGGGGSVIFRNLSYSVKVKKNNTRKVIVEGVSALVESGQLCAIFGPSGAGKSSLLDVISGRYGQIAGARVKGELMVAGQTEPRSIARTVAFVKQKDIHFGLLTVDETFMIGARLRLSKEVSTEERRQRVDDLIAMFDLRTCKHTRVGTGNETGTCSGGERKRISVALEMLSEPKVLMLDEPTTGLDAASALQVINLLRSLCDDFGQTIVCCIHQPRYEIFQQLDRLLVLQTGGSQTFFGSPDQCMDVLALQGNPCPEEINPADHILDVLSRERSSAELDEKQADASRSGRAVYQKKGDDISLENKVEAGTAGRLESKLAAAFRETDVSKELQKNLKRLLGSETANGTVYEDDDESGRLKRLVSRTKSQAYRETQASWFQQVYALTLRFCVAQYRDFFFTVSQAISYLVFGFILGLMYYNLGFKDTDINDRLSSIFLQIILLGLVPMFTPASVLPVQRPLINRELDSGIYSPSSLIIAWMLQTLPLFILSTFVLVTPAYWLIGYQSSAANYFAFLGIGILIMDVGYSSATGLAFMSPTIEVASIVISTFAVIWLTFGGLFVRPGQAWVGLQWLEYTSFCLYSFKALGRLEFSGLALTCTQVLPCPVTNQTVIYEGVEFNFTDVPQKDQCVMSTCLYKTGGDVVKAIEAHDNTVAEFCAIILGMTIIFKYLSYLSLKYVRVGGV